MIWRASTSLRLNAKGLSLIFKDSEERAPTGVMDALGKMVIAHHPRDVQVFDTHTAIPLGIVLGRLEVEVTALATNLQVLARDLSVRLPAAVTALRTTAYRALRLCQAFLSCAMVARILDHAALRVRQKDLQAHIKANGRMRTLHLPRRLPRMHDALLILCRCFTDDERIPVPIRAQDEMCSGGCAQERAMQLDLERLAQLGGHMQMLPVFV